MMCWYYRGIITRAADVRCPISPAAQMHLANCEACRTFYEFCMRLPRSLAGGESQAMAPELRQRILMRTTHAPHMARPANALFLMLENLAVGFPALWKRPLITLATVGLLLMVAWHWPRVGERLPVARGALQEVNGLYEQTVNSMATTAWPEFLDQRVTGEYQKLAEEASKAMDYFSGLLPSMPRAATSGEAGRSG